MNTKKFIATSNLGWHFFLRILKKIFFIKSPALRDFLAFYKEDKIAAMSLDEKNLLTEFGRCISCGLCDSFCPALGASGIGLGPSHLPHVSRSIPDFVGTVATDFEVCGGCHGCDQVCPVRVPIRKILEFMRTKNEEIAKA